MTQEDYEKKYKEALERARKIHNETVFDYEKGMMEEIFPELQENEDERIWKGLVKAVSGTLEGNTLFGTNVTREEALAWLEKQKPEMITPEESLGISSEEYNKIVDECIFDEQELSKWSEEDEKMFSFIQKKLTSEVDDWLNSLKQRME